MNKFKKTLSVVMAALMLVFTVMTYVPANAAEVAANAPEVTFVGIEHSPLVVGDTESFTIATKNADKVQYMISMKNDATGAVEKLTSDWTEAVDGTSPYTVKPAKAFELGKYTLIISAKRVSDGKLSADYKAAINCVNKDDKNRVYANGAVDMAKSEYALGEDIVVNGVKDLAGIQGPYKYRMHVYNATTDKWTNNVVPTYAEGKLTWKPTEAGNYVLDIHINTEKSTTWPTYVKDSTNTKTTYEAWKLVPVKVVDALKVTGVVAPNKNTVKVTYNMDVKDAAVAANFAVYDKGNEYAVKTINSVAVAKNVVTLTLVDNLATGKEFTVESKNVLAVNDKAVAATSKDNFTYTEVKTPASMALKATTLAKDDTLGYVIKDKDGNDITPNFANGDVVLETSNSLVIDATGKAIGLGTCIVNLSVKDTTVKTGNTIITVVSTLSKATSLGAYTLNTGDFKNPVTEAFVGSTPVLDFQILNQNGTAISATKAFKSYSPSIAVVDEKIGTVYPVAPGTATILVSATDLVTKETISKTVTITVKDTKKAASLQLDKTSVTLVKDANISQTVKVTLLDQYGNKFTEGTGTVTCTLADTTLATATPVAFNKGVATITLSSLNRATAGSTNMSVVLGTMKANVTVNSVLPATFAGYAAVAASSKLDKTPTSDYSDSPDNSVVTVYKVDTNGNYIATLATQHVYLSTEDKQVVTTNGTLVTAAKVGSEVITVKVDETTIATAKSVSIGTLTFNVVDTKALLATVSQVKNVITVKTGEDVFAALFGTDPAFVGYNQYKEKTTIATTDVQTFTSNVDVVSTNVGIKATSTEGSATLTLLIAGKVYVVTVKVVK